MSGKRRESKPAPVDPSTIGNAAAVNFAIAAGILDVHLRHVRRLVAEQELEVIGKGRHKRITTSSLRRYAGLVET